MQANSATIVDFWRARASIERYFASNAERRTDPALAAFYKESLGRAKYRQMRHEGPSGLTRGVEFVLGRNATRVSDEDGSSQWEPSQSADPEACAKTVTDMASYYFREMGHDALAAAEKGAEVTLFLATWDCRLLGKVLLPESSQFVTRALLRCLRRIQGASRSFLCFGPRVFFR